MFFSKKTRMEILLELRCRKPERERESKREWRQYSLAGNYQQAEQNWITNISKHSDGGGGGRGSFNTEIRRKSSKWLIYIPCTTEKENHDFRLRKSKVFALFDFLSLSTFLIYLSAVHALAHTHTHTYIRFSYDSALSAVRFLRFSPDYFFHYFIVVVVGFNAFFSSLLFIHPTMKTLKIFVVVSVVDFLCFLSRSLSCTHAIVLLIL